MNAYHSMPIDRFIDEIRAAAIAANARPLVIDKIDELRALPPEQVETQALLDAEIIRADNLESSLGEAKEWLQTVCEAAHQLLDGRDVPEDWEALRKAVEQAEF